MYSNKCPTFFINLKLRFTRQHVYVVAVWVKSINILYIDMFHKESRCVCIYIKNIMFRRQNFCIFTLNWPSASFLCIYTYQYNGTRMPTLQTHNMAKIKGRAPHTYIHNVLSFNCFVLVVYNAYTGRHMPNSTGGRKYIFCQLFPKHRKSFVII